MEESIEFSGHSLRNRSRVPLKSSLAGESFKSFGRAKSLIKEYNSGNF